MQNVAFQQPVQANYAFDLQKTSFIWTTETYSDQKLKLMVDINLFCHLTRQFFTVHEIFCYQKTSVLGQKS